MNIDSTRDPDRAALLRQGFDEAFSFQPRLKAEISEPMLLVRAAGEALALRIGDVGLLARIGRLLPVPSGMPELLGIVAIRGKLAPVFSLAAVLDLKDGGQETIRSKWIAVTHDESLVALAFDDVEGHVDVPTSTLYRHNPASSASDYVRQSLRLGSALRAVLDVPAIVAGIRRRADLNNADRSKLR